MAVAGVSFGSKDFGRIPLSMRLSALPINR